MLNTWAGDQNQYIPPNGSSGLTWVQNDLQYYVGTTGRPVVIVQHYGLHDTSWWTTANIQDFEAVLAPYNVVAWFSGHTHTLGVYSDPFAINTGNLDPNGIGNTLDNFVDGNAGDCTARGEGTLNVNGSAADATYCYDATMDFLTVTLSDKYLAVGAVSFSATTPFYNDNTIGTNVDGRPNSGNIGMVGTSATNTASCVKRLFSPGYQDISSQVTLTANSSQITVTNNSANAIQGPLAVWVSNDLGIQDQLTQWDFVDSCEASNAHQFLLLTEGGTLFPNTPMSIPYSSSHQDLANSQLHLYQLSDALQVSPDIPEVGTTPVQVTLSMTSGANVPFTYQLNPPNGIQQTWLTVTASSSTLPATLTLTPIILLAGTYTYTDQVIQIQPQVAGLAPTNVKVNLQEGTLSLSSNLPGATVQAYPTGCGTSPCYTPLLLPTSFAALSSMVTAQPPPAAPTGTRYTFSGWSDGGAATHNIEVPLTGYPLVERYETDYLIQAANSSGGTVSISPASPTNDGCYPSGTTLTVTATPNAGYYFVGFAGSAGLTGTTNPQTLTASAPGLIVGMFVTAPRISFNSTTPDGAGAFIELGCGGVLCTGGSYPLPYTVQIAPLTSTGVAVASSFVSSTNPGIQYIFTGWSDGVATSMRTINVGTNDAVFTANYQRQDLVTLSLSPAGAGTVTGGGWYNYGAAATLTATANGGYQFAGFSGNFTAASSPQNITVSNPLNIVANFSPQSPQLNLNAAVMNDSSTSSVSLGLSFGNSGLGTAAQIQVTNIAITDLSGTGTVTLGTTLPLAFGSVAGGATSSSETLNLNWPLAPARIRLTITYTYNSGAQGSQTLNLFR